MDSRGRKFQQQLVYEWKPSYCDKCQTIGHTCTTQQGPRMQQNEQPNRRRETKRVTYVWRYKWLVMVEIANKVNLLQPTTVQEQTQANLPVVTHENRQNQETTGAGDTRKISADKGKEVASLVINFDNSLCFHLLLIGMVFIE